jgi:hypothetical protein
MSPRTNRFWLHYLLESTLTVVGQKKIIERDKKLYWNNKFAYYDSVADTLIQDVQKLTLNIFEIVSLTEHKATDVLRRTAVRHSHLK